MTNATNSNSNSHSTYQQDLGIVLTMAALDAAHSSTAPAGPSRRNRKNQQRTRDPITHQKYKPVQSSGGRSRHNAGLRRSHQIMQPRPGF